MLAKAETGLQNTKGSKIKIVAVTTGVGLWKAHFLPNLSIYGQSRAKTLRDKPGLQQSAYFTQSAKELGLSSREQWEPLRMF
jgi:hypothetical protein